MDTEGGLTGILPESSSSILPLQTVALSPPDSTHSSRRGSAVQFAQVDTVEEIGENGQHQTYNAPASCRRRPRADSSSRRMSSDALFRQNMIQLIDISAGVRHADLSKLLGPGTSGSGSEKSPADNGMVTFLPMYLVLRCPGFQARTDRIVPMMSPNREMLNAQWKNDARMIPLNRGKGAGSVLHIDIMLYRKHKKDLLVNHVELSLDEAARSGDNICIRKVEFESGFIQATLRKCVRTIRPTVATDLADPAASSSSSGRSRGPAGALAGNNSSTGQSRNESSNGQLWQRWLLPLLRRCLWCPCCGGSLAGVESEVCPTHIIAVAPSQSSVTGSSHSHLFVT